jgi:hypothetical protein
MTTFGTGNETPQARVPVFERGALCQGPRKASCFVPQVDS